MANSYFVFYDYSKYIATRSQCKILISFFFFKSTTSSFSFRCKNWPHSLYISLSRSSAVSLNCIQWKGEVKFLVVFYVYLVCRRPLIWAWISLSRHVYVDRWPFPLRGDAEGPRGSIASLIRRLVTSLMFMHATRLALLTYNADVFEYLAYHWCMLICRSLKNHFSELCRIHTSVLLVSLSSRIECQRVNLGVNRHLWDWDREDLHQLQSMGTLPWKDENTHRTDHSGKLYSI